MSLLLSLLLLGVPAAPPEEPEEIVVSARVGRVALVFDKGGDGRLRNCRVFKSSGVNRIDAAACTDLPDCFRDDKGEEYCGNELASNDLRVMSPKEWSRQMPGKTVGAGKLATDLPKLVQPEPVRSPPATGPALATKADEPTDRLGKLPPPPKDKSGEPGLRVTGSAGNSGNGIANELPRDWP